MAEIMHDIFGPGSNPEGRIFLDINQLTEKVNSCRQLGLKIVLTSGTFDLAHIGHYRYLEKAKQNGDVLIVGVDSDEKVKEKKGPHRPMVDEKERMEILCHCRHVDILFLKEAKDPRWHLIKTIQPDILIVSEREYQPGELEELKENCGDVILLEAQALTSTTAKIRLVLIAPVKEIKDRLKKTVEEVNNFLDSLTGGVE